MLKCGGLILLHILSMLCFDRNHPARGVLEDETLPTLVFATICTKKRRPWLAYAAGTSCAPFGLAMAQTRRRGSHTDEHSHLKCAEVFALPFMGIAGAPSCGAASMAQTRRIECKTGVLAA